MSWRREVHCGWCGQKGHNQRGCPAKKEYIEKNPNTYTAKQAKSVKERVKWRAKHRTCSYCGNSGHNRQTCPTLKKDIEFVQKKNQKFMRYVKQSFKDIGLGVGTLISKYNPYKEPTAGDDLYLVTKINWGLLSFAEFTGYKEYDGIFELRKISDGTKHTVNSGFLEGLHKSIHEKIGEDKTGWESVWNPRTVDVRIVSALDAKEVHRQIPKDFVRGSKVSQGPWLDNWNSSRKYKERYDMNQNFLYDGDLTE
tara:strand:+ start:208 stop:966 length:759 start_codon:yes stop_codon:yes gene_type:complete